MRVLILEDEPSMAALLEQLVKHLWPQAEVFLEISAVSALEQWRARGADLALLDWELPGMSGIEVLKQIKRSESKTVCVMVSAHADRHSILAAGVHHVDAFIVKPFDIDEVKTRLSQIMATPSQVPRTDSEDLTKKFLSIDEFLAFTLTRGTLGVPIDPEFVNAIKGIHHLNAEDMRCLLQRCQCDPAIVLRVLSLANSHGYIRGADPLETFGGALRCIGLDGLINLSAEMSLLPGSALKQDLLRAKYLELQSDCNALADIVTQLSAKVEFDVEAARTACRLSRIGELSLLPVMQAWLDLGQSLDETRCAAILARHAARAADRINSQWALPNTTHDRIGAVSLLPAGTVRKEQLVMRIAGLLQGGDPNQELPRLLARLGLPASAVEPKKVTINNFPPFAKGG
ncbi:response regulator [Thiorhodococcus mannitoliphagus]|uniref:Response regulator n=2 Tax=Thiorhodococcus mannitoliphagus TaxID=329406 RepID=A0A6P1DXR2_9GAMM|nr:response regulator [Thiorhodococcus mannitoliphagus]NEX21863.1 response regulator [Thiorhodococcus mannitoliphagus]